MKNFICAVMIFFVFLIHLSFAEEPKADVGQIKAANIYGDIVSIDSQNPQRLKITVKNKNTGGIETLEVSPRAGILKLVTINELGAGDLVNVIYNEVDGKRIARTVIFRKVGE